MRLALVKELVEPPRLNHGNIGRCCSVICWGYLQPQLACVPNQETLYSSHNKAGHIFELNVLVNYSLYSLLMILLVDLEVLPWGTISEILKTTLFFSDRFSNWNCDIYHIYTIWTEISSAKFLWAAQTEKYGTACKLLSSSSQKSLDTECPGIFLFSPRASLHYPCWIARWQIREVLQRINKLMELHTSLCNCMQACVAACKLT